MSYDLHGVSRICWCKLNTCFLPLIFQYELLPTYLLTYVYSLSIIIVILSALYISTVFRKFINYHTVHTCDKCQLHINMKVVLLVPLMFLLSFQFLYCFEYNSVIHDFAIEFQSKRLVVHSRDAVKKNDIKPLLKW